MTPPVFVLNHAGVSYDTSEVLRSVSLAFEARQFVAIAGPNGAGKSTLLSLLAGLLPPTSGNCLFHGRPAHRWNRREFARRVAVVLQAEPSTFPFTAEQVVSMGRMPHRTGLHETPEDSLAVNEAMAATTCEAFRDRDFRTLSGGEKQRVLLASALAQQPKVLLLDEPATHLDLEHQIALHKTLKDLAANGFLVIAVTHDLNLAAAYADRLVLLKDGEVRADGTPAAVLSTHAVEEVFHIHAQVHQRISGQPWLVYGE